MISMRIARGGFLSVLWISLATAAMPLCDYQSPLTDLSDLALSFAYQYTNDPYGSAERDTNVGWFAVDYTRIYDTAEYGFDIEFESEMEVSLLDLSQYTTVADGNYKRYWIEDSDAFAFAGASARSSSSFALLGVSLTAGLGYGRFADVTPLALATRIEDELVRTRALSGPLHPVDLQILAYELESAETYESLAALLSAVQEIIEGSGRARSGGLNAVDLSRLTKLIEEEGFSRYCGWDVKLGAGFELLDPSGGPRDLLLSAGFNYAFTTTPNAQLLVRGSLSGPLSIKDTNRVDFSATYDYLITRFLELRVGYAFSRETWVAEPTDIHRITLDLVLTPLEQAGVTLGISLERRPYYLEWLTDVRFSISMDLV
ncbi:MAG: hypothetical protein AB1778_09575 [Candidatus Bipolaricaulota bacterium]